MSRRAFTILEVLIVAAVLSIIVAIAFPIYRSAANRSKETECFGKLHNLGMNIGIYREQFGGDGVYGEADKMALPPHIGALQKTLELPWDSFFCSLQFEDSTHQYVFQRMYSYENKDYEVPTWADYSRKYLDESVVYADIRHDPNFDKIHSPYVLHSGLGLNLAGSVKKVVKIGDIRLRRFWN